MNLGKRQRTDDSSEDEDIEDTQKKMKADYSDETKRKNADKDKKVQATIDSLKTKHGVTAFTPMQYRLWAEMYHGGVHPGLDTPPTTTMFVRAGGGTTKKTGHTSNIGEVVSQAITQLTSALSPKTTLPSAGGSAGSPPKVIENRSKCYKQLSDLKNLHESGVLSEEEYCAERSVIVEMLKKLV